MDWKNFVTSVINNNNDNRPVRMEDSSGNDFQFPSTQYSGNDKMLLGRKIVMEDSGSQLVLYIITGWLIGWKKKSDIDSGINQEPAVLKVTFGSISSCI